MDGKSGKNKDLNGIYRLSNKDKVRIISEYLIISAVAAWVFYDSIAAFCIILPGLVIYYGFRKGKMVKKKKTEMKSQFLKSLEALEICINAGMSSENAIYDTRKEMERVFSKNSLICREYLYMENGLKARKSVCDVLREFANRTDIEEIKDFALCFEVAGESSGDYRKVIGNCISLIESGIRTKEEILVTLEGRIFEQKVMNIIPVAIIAYLRYSSSGFLDVLYRNTFGRVFMSICLVLYIVAAVISDYFTRINV